MMPGETHSKAAGTAADASGCQGCSALQQNLNEYVAALITLKQKIIDTDNLLTEYQKKCDKLQFAERENSALRKQVEQMLQKISPLEKCQEELGCLKAELEEKKSSLKIYQDSYHEYTRVKEECLKSDARKKKLEAKVKKLEEAAVKHTEDLKQLKIEKKTLEKELKKTQEKLDEFPKQNSKKVLKHMGTQSSSNEPVETLDKKKIKLLLKELWLCIDSTKERLQNEDNEDVQEKAAKENTQSRKSVEEYGLLPRVQSNNFRSPEMKTCLRSFSVQLEQELLGGCRSIEEDGPITVNVQDCSNDSAFHEDRNPEVFVPSSWDENSSDSSDPEDMEDKPLMKDLEAIFDLFRLPPPLLSPVSTPPPTPLRCQVPSSSPLAPQLSKIHIQSQNLKLTSCVTLGKPLNFSVPSLPPPPKKRKEKVLLMRMGKQQVNLLNLNLFDLRKLKQLIVSCFVLFCFSPQEDYFGDFTDSSEEELVDREHTMQSLLENGTSESLNTSNSSEEKEESSKLIEQIEPDLGTQVPVNLEMNEETAIGCDILPTGLKFKSSKPNSKEIEMPFSCASPLLHKEHLAVSNENTKDENKYVLDENGISQDDKERNVTPLQSKRATFRIPHIPTETECLHKISDDLMQVTDNVELNEEICNSLLSQEKLIVQVTSEEKISLPGSESHKFEFSKQIPVNGLSSENEKMAMVSEHLQEITGELPGKDRKEMQGFNKQNPSESKQDVLMMDTSELDVKTDVLSSSPHVMSSNCSNPQFSFDLGYNNEVSWKFNGQCTLIEVVNTDFLNETVPNQLHCAEQKSCETMHNNISDTVDKHPEPTDCPKEEYNVEKNIHALSPNSATPILTDQNSRETKYCDESKGVANTHVIDQATFEKDTGDKQCETEKSGVELNTTKSNDLISTAFQSDLVKRDHHLDISSSCHNIDAGMVIEREYEGSPEAKLSCEQEDNKQLQTEIPVIENVLSSPKLDSHRKEVKPITFTFNNQVSIISEQLKSEELQVTNLEDLGSHVKESTLRPDNTYTETEQHMLSKAEYIDKEKCQLLKVKQRETVNCPSAEDSASWISTDLNCFSESLLVENSHYDTIRKLSIRSEEISLQSQKSNVSEVDKKQDLQNQGHLSTMNTKGEFTPSTNISLPDDLATEEICSGDASISDLEVLITPLDSVSLKVQQVQKERTPGNTCLNSYMKEECAFPLSLSKKNEDETQVRLNILNDIVQCYMGSPDDTKHSSEDEKYDQISYDSKSKNETETNRETKEQNFNKEPQMQIGKTNTYKDAHACMKRRGSLDIEYLTSALKDFNLSTVSETNGFSTSEIFKLLENNTQNCISGNSVSECFDKVLTNKEMKNKLKIGKVSEENLRKHSWVKTHEVSKETNDSEEEWNHLSKVKHSSQFTYCLLGETTKTYTKDVSGIENICKDSLTKSPDVSFLKTCNNITAGCLKEKSLSCEITTPSSDIKQSSLILDFDAERKSCTDRFVNENTQRREHTEHSDAAKGRNDSKDTTEIGKVGKSTIEQNTGNSKGGMLLHHISRINPEIVNGYGKHDNLNLNIKESEDWMITKDGNIQSSMDQTVVHEVPEAVSRGQAILSGDILEDALDPLASTEYTSNAEQNQSDSPSNECYYDDSSSSRQKDGSKNGQNCIFDKDTLWNPSMCDVSFDSQENNQTSESSSISFDSTHDTLELLELNQVDLVSQSKRGSKMPNQESSHKLTKALAKSKVEVKQGKTSKKSSRIKSKVKIQHSHLAQPVLATADTSTPTKCSPDTLSKIRQEMGPPLPPLLAPLLATPPRTLHPVSPLMSTSSQSSLTSPLDDLISPLRDTPVPPLMSPLSDDPRYKSPMHSTPSPSDASASQRILSSPLQFCAATPKHALPVPGRLPPLAVGNTSLGGPQENSVKILDTMYPELSARARTLNILKGNIQLNRCPPADCKNLPGPVNNITGFKAITSASTAFVKTGSTSNTECDQGKLKDFDPELTSFQSHGGKRPLVPSTILRSAKRLRLDSESPKLEIKVDVSEIIKTSSPQAENVMTLEDENSSVQELTDNTVAELSSALHEHKESHDSIMSNVLKKIAESSFDLLPVIRSHVHVGNVSKKPVMRDQEKEVVCEFSTTKKHLAQPLLHAILSELKIHKTSLDYTYIHALCRVYVGICRQLGDLERARLFCYDLLKEDFPESDKLTLFIANIWHDIFAFQGVINKAMQLVVRQRAKGEVLNCLITYLNWEKTSSLDVSMMISKLLLTIQLCPKMQFHLSEKFGEDLNDDTWEYIFALDLLCCHQKWVWTHDNIISKELWPVMDKWIKHRKGHLNIAYTPDIIVALILRLIGRLGQLGLKEGFASAVKNISSVICMFIQHSNEEDVPWSIQLAAVYALCDLSPSNPAEVSKVLENWTRVTTKNIPSAVVSCLAEVNLLCAAELS
ncbi:little elongation complex subunit 1 [Antechinus flavipes]|uniref:little elongation complex subunit 1 n=1 Tax=Antechinus flavipes TaxID=38775 RepID=UPI002235905D|nr:little elongation complex subunit 1 [Antechinus flavipes]